MQNEATARIPFLQASIEAKEKFYYNFVEQKNTFIGRNRMSNSKEVP